MLEQHLTQEQQNVQLQQQRLSAQQVMLVRLIEMPLAQFEQSVRTELEENPALESEDPHADDMLPVGDSYRNDDDDDNDDYSNDSDSNGDDFDDDKSEAEQNASFEKENERQEREDALDSALEEMGSDDRMTYDYRTSGAGDDGMSAEQEEIIYGEAKSFYDGLMDQVAELDIDEKQRQVMEYLICSLDDDGLLRTSPDNVSDVLAIYHGLDVSKEYVEEVLKMLQSLDPAGIGAQSLQECLLLQIARREDSKLKRQMRKLIKNHFDDLKFKRWEKMRQHLAVSEAEAAKVISELRKLNPRPGSSLGETMGRSMQHITPDFIVEPEDNGTVSFSINDGDIPTLKVSRDFEEQMQGFMKNPKSLNRMEKEALMFSKEKIERAQGYIDAIAKRRRSMHLTMKAIIELQHRFFTDGDESDLVPMTLKDVADRVGMDISTVSRVCNSKYVDTPWGIFKLKHFFSIGVNLQKENAEASSSSEATSSRKIKIALAEIIKEENKKKPLSDDAIAALLKQQGFPIARRTVAKYRDALGIPVARMRK